MEEGTVIRTEKWVLITEAHPYHRYIKDERSQGGNAIVAKAYDERCPICQKEKQDESQ